ncbi:MAG: GHKL domain-containing protein [Bacteroidia bacterium]|nr:GHKL domain-containing protein [Bacteroidia bacterium]
MADGTLYSTARDVTRIKNLEAELRANNLDLKRSNEELDKFAYLVSHDLKAPLRAINSLVEFIVEDISEGNLEEISHHSDMLKGRVKRMGELIGGILEYAKIGRQTIKSESIATGLLLAEILENLSPPPEIEVVVQPAMPTLKGPRVRLEQVFTNLLSNAIKYMDKPKGRVEISWKEAGLFIEFSVKDNGEGIDPEFHEKIFGMFQRLQSRDEVEGTGIGLAMVRRIVEEAGGEIKLESQPGQGATFSFTWPKNIGNPNQD